MRWSHVCARLATAGIRHWHVDSLSWKRLDRRSCRKSLSRFVEKFNEQSADDFVRHWNRTRRRTDLHEEAHERRRRHQSKQTFEKLFTRNVCRHRKALEIDPWTELNLPLLKNAFRKQALSCHPDVQVEGICKKEAAKRFHLVQQAYEILSKQLLQARPR